MRSNEYRYCACRMLALAIKRSTSHLLQPAIVACLQKRFIKLICLKVADGCR